MQNDLNLLTAHHRWCCPLICGP